MIGPRGEIRAHETQLSTEPLRLKRTPESGSEVISRRQPALRGWAGATHLPLRSRRATLSTLQPSGAGDEH